MTLNRPRSFHQPCRLEDKFIAEGRLIVGIGQADIALRDVFFSQGDDLFRRQVRDEAGCWEICQFWQKGQVKLQPQEPRDKMLRRRENDRAAFFQWDPSDGRYFSVV
mgnify:CR=1 FL=1